MDALQSDRFDAEWAKYKLDLPRRQRELRAHIDKWLPEIRTMPRGCVVDIGCGPGDFLSHCKLAANGGHSGYGVDAPNGSGGMGDAYLRCCREHRKLFGVRVEEIGAVAWIDATLSHPPDIPLAVIHCRGAIEQCFAVAMRGEPHDLHHNCKLLDWDQVEGERHLRRFVMAASALLRPGGVLLVIANGTKSTDEWYAQTMIAAARENGLDLVRSEGFLAHKWVMTEDAGLTERSS